MRHKGCAAKPTAACDSSLPHDTLIAMSLFCFFFMPALYLWRRAVSSEKKPPFPEPGLISGFCLGLAVAFARLSVGEVFVQRGFGLAAFAAQLIDGAPFDSMLPLAVYFLLRRFGSRRRFEEGEAVIFSLAWLTPLCAFRAIFWSSVPDPVRLMVVPVLYAALAVSLPYWIGKIIEEYGFAQAAAVSVVVLLPFAAAAATWALYTQRLLIGAVFFTVSASASIPALLYVYGSRRRSRS